MRVRIPKYTWIHVVDDNGQVLSQQCTQEVMHLVSEDYNQGKKDSEKTPDYATMGKQEAGSG